MKPKILKLNIIILLLLLFGAGCEKDDFPPLEDKDLTIIETNSVGCKENLKSTDTDKYVELKAEGENRLRIKFINAYINCAGVDTTYAVIDDGILKVIFFEYTFADCKCNFDVECLIDSVENRTYNLEIYTLSEKPKAKFTFKYSPTLDSKTLISNN